MIRLSSLVLLPCFLVGALPAQAFEFLPGTRYNAAVPSMRKVLGHTAGERLTNHAEVLRYCRALAAGSDNVLLRKHGASWEGRDLIHLVIGSQKNLARLDWIQQGMARLADPRGLSEADANALLADLPSITWLGFSVHGNELSCTDAGLMLAYHLAAAQNDPVASAVLDNSVVILDPLLNPDGRERFVSHFRQTRGRWIDTDPRAAEHNEPWPGGRTNHYLFDMNRDWIVATQPETRARIELFQKWWPQVFADVHTMGTNSSYYFPPPAKPVNPEITSLQREWLLRYGQNNAKWFDRFGFDYFTRESFDAFYPGYGEGWPMFHGSIGMTFEAASVRGIAVRRDDESVLRFRDTVRHHFVACLATAETCAKNRRDALAAFLEYRRSAATSVQSGQVQDYFLPEGRDPQRVRKLVDLLVFQGVEVHRLGVELKSATAKSIRGGATETRTFSVGTYRVHLNQPASRLARVLLARHFAMEPDFLAEQKKKHRKRQRTEFYDLTAWSLPLLFGVECFESRAELPAPRLKHRTAPRSPVVVRKAKVAYLVPWGRNVAAAFLAALQRAGVRVHCAGKSFTIDKREFAAGCLIVKVRGNDEQLHGTVQHLANEHGAEVVPLDSSWVDEGISLGSNHVKFLPKPKVAMLWDRPANSGSAGHARFVLEQQFGQPVTVIRTRQLASADLKRFNVLILPSGRYGSELKGAIQMVKAWIRDGGTLVAIGGAIPWLSGKDVGLLAAKTEDRQKPKDPTEPDQAGEKSGKAKEKEKEKKPTEPQPKPFDYDKAILPDKERPARTPGAILNVALDREHWVAFGYDGHCNAVSTSSAVFTPIKLDQGTNVGIYAPRDELLLAGFVFDDKLDQLPGKAWLVHQPHGRGHVVAFTEDPNYRAFADGLNLLFMNAVLLGPGF